MQTYEHGDNFRLSKGFINKMEPQHHKYIEEQAEQVSIQ